MSHYKQLNLYEREELSRGLSQGLSLRQIANLLKRSASTISRELKRNLNNPENYRASYAQIRASQLSHKARRKIKLKNNKRLLRFIVKQLYKRWSPQQIAKKLRILYPNDMSMNISHESIYTYLYVYPKGQLKKELSALLRRQHKKRCERKDRIQSCPIQNYISIDQRPPEVDSRKIAGHWEGDLIMGSLNKSAIGTLVERTTRRVFICKLEKKDAKSVREAFEKKFKKLPTHMKRSLTYDQGQEMAQHKEFSQRTRIQVYFAHPHSPWQRGTSENTNMLIRDFFPKGTDFSKVTARELTRVQSLLNERPRKTLNWRTPDEVFNELVALKT